MDPKQIAVEQAAQVLRNAGLRPQLAELRGEGIALMIDGVYLSDIGYNHSGKNNPLSEKEVDHVST